MAEGRLRDERRVNGKPIRNEPRRLNKEFMENNKNNEQLTDILE